MAKGTIRREDYSKLLNLLGHIEKEPNAAPFLEPVDWKNLGLNDYPKIVKRPIDLGTIKNNLKEYTSYETFFSDIQLVWDNCKQYNIAESEIYRMAEELERTTKKLIQKFTAISSCGKKRSREDEIGKSDEDDDEDEDTQITFDDRIRFTDNVRKLTIEQMTTLIRMIQEECPNVLDDLDSDKLQIKVDDIDKPSFDKLVSYCKKWVSKDSKQESSKEAEVEAIKSKPSETPQKSFSNHSGEQADRSQDDEESKQGNHTPSSGSHKYGPEGKRMKIS